MAKLPQASSGTGLVIKDLAPDGQHIAVCLRIPDLFQVERPTFANPQVNELTDVTRFIFGLIGADKKPYIIQTYEFTISGAPGANLMKFLKAWLGRDAEIGWDYSTMVKQGAMITVARKASKKPGVFYANITGIAPVHPQLAAHVPDPRLFDSLLAELERGSGGQQPVPPAPPGPNMPYPPVAQPTPPPPPPPVVASRKIFVHVNGQATLMDLSALSHLAATGQGNLPAIYEGDTQWSTVSQLAPKAVISAPTFPPPPIPAAIPGATTNPTDEESVPF